ncbi:hypothetical protein IMAU80668_00848 [Lactobacillus helveticus]|nr:hypothetical protein [Lactobacillus helveticus]NRO42581.1 hypothetical protein [Lactobacillus helveticus]
MTLIERKTRCQLLRLIEGRDADSVSYALRGIKREWGACIKTITADNGPEFTALNTAFAGTETEIFYAHPYTSCDRGTNEAHNRMIRQDFPKGMSLDDISPSQVQATQDRLNQLPRKQQGYCTPQQNFEAEARRSPHGPVVSLAPQLLFDNGPFWDCPQRLANLFLQFTFFLFCFLVVG